MAMWSSVVRLLVARFSFNGLVFLGVICADPLSAQTLSAQTDLQAARPFLQQYCVACHGPAKQGNGLRFDNLSSDLSEPESLEHWQAIVDQLNLGAMPPSEHRQPSETQVVEVVQRISSQLKLAYARQRSTGGKTVVRRLNRYELRSTLRDLLYLQGNADYDAGLVTKLEDRNGNGRAQWNSEDPTREFPADEVIDGFDNIGGRLVMSDFLLKQVIAAAESSLKLATHAETRPSFETRRYSSPIRPDPPRSGLQMFAAALSLGYDGIYQRYREPGASTGGMGRVGPNELVRGGVGRTAQYQITIEASAHHQRHSWGDLIKRDPDEPMLLGLHIADSKRGGLGENPTSRQLMQWVLPGDGGKQTLTFECWLDETWFPWLGWENGPYDRALRPSMLVEQFVPDAYKSPPAKGAPQKEKQDYERAMAAALFTAGYKGPHLRIHSLAIEPIDKTWPPRGHVALYGGEDEVAGNAVDGLIRRFIGRAFRRPAKPAEVHRYVQLIESQMAAGASREEALRVGYTAALASPNFYYLQESEGRLGDYELASRLSYFLWSSMPDEELFSLAASGNLSDPDILLAQVERMLNHPNSAAFVRRFPQRWLRIDRLGTMPPPGGFYFHREMELEMREQVDAFFSHLVHTNGPIREIVESDYTFLNERVSQWIYKRDDVWGDRFRKVPAKPPHGGGMMTMPAVMTATANGVDTSPVVRGVWVLESILGTPPSPPPPDVEPLSPDLRDAKTIREQLIAHREQAACNRCHLKIDPLGFPFEHFDELGLYREKYRIPGGQLAIDPSARLADGREVSNIEELKQLLLTREDQITRNLTEKMLAYAGGRLMEPLDRGSIDAIVEQLTERSGGVRDLIKLVVQSDVFLTK
ncbi:MAG: DUF1592 domain-containing protein [Rubripirellula sp.]|nr:DUF1592 domain-containing protein [Rubripirellula sp.]